MSASKAICENASQLKPTKRKEMKLTKIEFSIRTPTEECGYIEGRYFLEAEDDSPEELKSQMQFYMSMQEHTIEDRKKALEKEKLGQFDLPWGEEPEPFPR